MKKTSEIVLFKAFVERGLAIPACDFLRGLLFFWGVQLCEAFLGIHPHFDLFKSLFSLNLYPNLRNIARVGGADLQFRPGMAEKYNPVFSASLDWGLESGVVLYR